MEKVYVNAKKIQKRAVVKILKNIENATGILCDEEIVSIGDLEMFCFKNRLDPFDFFCAI
ncbi:hypothetical protein [Campylobacter sp. RM12651]|uniref:hypothetical protein n=1 Tax=Campylobacter sp. RM12651 TaxID=1660079 RepID=UPI001EFB9E1E|nr:hypothetical protein [Campylobacter sp. RM12651]ULO04562.1 hypothetical protein AVBRAN_a0080 [Campylobacter sp. RM12651]